jgi:hypothetical protein
LAEADLGFGQVSEASRSTKVQPKIGADGECTLG